MVWEDLMKTHHVCVCLFLVVFEDADTDPPSVGPNTSLGVREGGFLMCPTVFDFASSSVFLLYICIQK